MFKQSSICLLILFCCSVTKAQPAFDTIKACLENKPQLFVKLDSRNSFISNSRAKILGAKLGLNYANRLYFGVGYNQLDPPAKDFDKQVYYINSTNIRDSATATLKLFYISTHAEYTYYQTKNWNLSILLQLGIGKTYYQYLLSGQKININENFIFIYEPAISIEYKIIRWAGIGADVGFRFMFADYKNINQKFNSPTYAFKLLIYYNEIYKSISKRIKEKR